MSRKRVQGNLIVQDKDHPDAPVRMFYIKHFLDELDKLSKIHIGGATRQRVVNEVRRSDWNGSWLSLSGTLGKRCIFTFRRHGGIASSFVAALCHEDRGEAQFFLRLSRSLQRISSAIQYEVREPTNFEEFYRLLLRHEYFGPLIEEDVIPPKDPYR